MLAVLVAMGALIALIVPASSMAATFTPAGSQFEIKNTEPTNMMVIVPGYGWCSLSRVGPATISGPGERAYIPAPTVGSCSAGASLILRGTWALESSGASRVAISGNTDEAFEMSFASAGGCVVTNSVFGLRLFGTWVNGTTSPFTPSTFSANGGSTGWSTTQFIMIWQPGRSGGGKCSKPIGERQEVLFQNYKSPSTVTNLTNPVLPILYK
jgi:hypothetical protein